MQGKLQGVVVCERDELIGMKTDAIQWGSDMRLALALCSDLTPLHRNTLAGHPDEKKIFKSIEAAYLVCLQACLHAIASILLLLPAHETMQWHESLPQSWYMHLLTDTAWVMDYKHTSRYIAA